MLHIICSMEHSAHLKPAKVTHPEESPKLKYLYRFGSLCTFKDKGHEPDHYGRLNEIGVYLGLDPSSANAICGCFQPDKHGTLVWKERRVKPIRVFEQIQVRNIDELRGGVRLTVILKFIFPMSYTQVYDLCRRPLRDCRR